MKEQRELTDAELDALDPYAPDPNWRPRQFRRYPEIVEQVVHDEASLRSACRNDVFWAHAAAFGAGPIDASGHLWVDYMEALAWLSREEERKDGRYRYGPKARAEADDEC